MIAWERLREPENPHDRHGRLRSQNSHNDHNFARKFCLTGPKMLPKVNVLLMTVSPDLLTLGS